MNNVTQTRKKEGVNMPALWRHQKASIQFIHEHRETLLNAWMGVGKTRIVVESINRWSPGRVLIAAPKSVLGVWRRELEAWGRFPHSVCILDQRTGVAKARAFDAAIDSQNPVVIVSSYDSLRSEALRVKALRVSWTETVCDESHRIKGGTSKISKIMARLSRGCRKVIAMSGTPIINNPLDLFGQMRFLDPSLLGDDWHAFSRRFGVPELYNGRQVYRRFSVNMAAELSRLVAPLTFHVSRSVLSHLPSITHQTMPIELGARVVPIRRSVPVSVNSDVPWAGFRL
jgi:SNF2 family DNA or RNA helicase